MLPAMKQTPVSSRRRALGLAAGLAACVGGAALASCSSEEDTCGPLVTEGEVVVADLGSSGASLRFSELRARPNNDCPAADAPDGVVSLTISGVAVGGTAPFTLCVPRPDLLEGARTLGGADAHVELVDVVGNDGSCTYRQQRGSTASGSVIATGVCDNGRDAAGFSLMFFGEVSVERTCGAVVDVLRMKITGEVPVVKSST